MTGHQHGLEQAAAPSPPRTRFPALDTLRAVGALSVLTTHAAFWAGDYTRHGVWGALLARLDVGVALFFVLSGFLLSRPWLLSALDGRDRPRPWQYLRRRWWRIAPLYVVTVVLALGLIEENRDLGWVARLRTLLMLDTTVGTSFPAGLTHMWSLAVEVTFYLLLPLLMLALLGRVRGVAVPLPRVWTGLAVLSVISVWWHLDGATRAGSWIGGSPTQWLPAFLTWFALGIALALLRALRDRGRTPRAALPVLALAQQPGACWTLAVAALVAAATPVAGPAMFNAPTPAQSLTKHLLYALIAALVVLPSVLGGRDRYDRLMSAGLPRRLGWISYGVFCLHLPLLHLVMWATGWELFVGRGLQIWLITVLLSIVAAELAYRVVERPALKLAHRPGRLAGGRADLRDTTGADTSATSAGTQR